MNFLKWDLRECYVNVKDLDNSKGDESIKKMKNIVGLDNLWTPTPIRKSKCKSCLKVRKSIDNPYAFYFDLYFSKGEHYLYLKVTKMESMCPLCGEKEDTTSLVDKLEKMKSFSAFIYKEFVEPYK